MQAPTRHVVGDARPVTAIGNTARGPEPMTNSYDVGYRKPPKHGQFRKGRSGNPTGRKKGSHNLKTDLYDELFSKITISEGGRRRQITKSLS